MAERCRCYDDPNPPPGARCKLCGRQIAPLPHTCHADGCGRHVPPRMFMCRPHWFSLRAPTRDAIWREYRPGQENDKRPSLRYLAVQQFAVGEAAFKPHDEAAALRAAEFFMNAARFAKLAIEKGLGDPLEDLIPVMPTTPSKKKRKGRGLSRLSAALKKGGAA